MAAPAVTGVVVTTFAVALVIMTGPAVTAALIKQRNVFLPVVPRQIYSTFMRDHLLCCAQIYAALHMTQAGRAPEPFEHGVLLMEPKARFECPEDDAAVVKLTHCA
jgi:hypothetical protein